MNLIRTICKRLYTECEQLYVPDPNINKVIRADQMGELPSLPYVTYKVINDRKGVGRENIEHVDGENELIEKRSQERNATISFNVYGTSHDNAFEVAKQLRKWFEWRGSLFLEEINVALVSVSAVDNRSVFLVDAYDEKYGFDVIIRYTESDDMKSTTSTRWNTKLLLIGVIECHVL